MKNTKLTIELDKALVLLFIYLKLEGKIDWSWVWVTSPVWVMILIEIITSAAINTYRKIKNKTEDEDCK